MILKQGIESLTHLPFSAFRLANIDLLMRFPHFKAALWIKSDWALHALKRYLFWNLITIKIPMPVRHISTDIQTL
jgi:hypothetical protein